ncbi:kynureninase Ecym_4151 [Eremothecium cymbalariae DBVPG|uniref:Kynureninase n=1 Tax=Eremothecium cymbalariae (strain CBS 270.75 / DBVPG 7215 / KCTC 17166 / NRRL Y-17582) TaxID=931890 RepID=G8JT75_ERECY|nr:hypothetical protein Ecym_4151 [Eremothecium cymbalariae DBVPG\
MEQKLTDEGFERCQKLEAENATFLREEFCIPTYKSLGISTDGLDGSLNADSPVAYLCGNSLGCMPKGVRSAVNAEFDVWAARAVVGHHHHPRWADKGGWINVDEPLLSSVSSLVGALEEEVAVMGSLTANLNAMLVAFYKPNGRRNKIMFEKSSFPSDFHAFWNIARLRGLDPEEILVQVAPREGEYCLRTDDILAAIETHRDTLALVCFSGIQYYTGQLFEMEKITKFAHRTPELIVGWDIAHAMGNVPMKLHDWGVDFASWCSYKYLNAGPGTIGGLFVHQKYGKTKMPRLAGWWGNNRKTLPDMVEVFDPLDGASGFRQSNPGVLDVVSVQTSLKLFEKFGGIEQVRVRSLKLTGYLYELLISSPHYREKLDNKDPSFSIITPEDPMMRGAQLSLIFGPEVNEPNGKNTAGLVFEYLNKHGVIVDERAPSVIRFTPVALYNTFQDVYYAVRILNRAFEDAVVV